MFWWLCSDASSVGQKSWYKLTKTGWESRIKKKRKKKRIIRRAWNGEPKANSCCCTGRQTHDINGSSASAYQRKHITLMVRKCMCTIFNMILIYSASLFMILFSSSSSASCRLASIRNHRWSFFSLLHQIKLVFYWSTNRAQGQGTPVYLFF